MPLVKPIIALLTANEKIGTEVLILLKEELGNADFIGGAHPFIHTSYYEEEMGENLSRNIVSFEKNISPEKVVDLKFLAKKLEDKFRVDENRKINIDPGYLDLHKVVLASAKGGGHMLYIANGIYADFLLWYNKGWQPLPWAYPDFKDGTYFKDLEEIRKKFKNSTSHFAHRTS